MIDTLRSITVRILKKFRRIVRRIRKGIYRRALRVPWMRFWARKSQRIGSQFRYWLYYKRKAQVDPKVIVFDSFMGRSYSENPRAVYEYMLADSRFADYTFIWAFKNPESKQHIPELKRAVIVKYKSRDYYRYCAMAGTWLFNSRALLGLIRGKNQKYIQTWHGTPLKRIGHDITIEGGNAMNSLREFQDKWIWDAQRYTALLSSAPYTSEIYPSCFALDKLKLRHIMQETGSPRNDALVRQRGTDTAAWKKRLSIPADKKTLLYTPTFRDNQHEIGVGYTYENELDFTALRQEIGDEYVVLFRAHYFVASSFDFAAHKGFVYDVSGVEDIAQLYMAADMLITDYSSVFFDYMILERPILFYMYDLEKYQNEIRGFYLSLDELPGQITKTMPELVESIRQAKNGVTVPREKWDALAKKILPFEDGEASKRVAEMVLNRGTSKC